MNQPSDAWPVTKGGGLRLAVLDTGHNGDPVLGRVLMVKDFTKSPRGTKDEAGHGTYVAEAARAVAPACRVLVGKVEQRDGVVLQHVIAGLEWALDNDAAVVNMSIDLGQRESASFAVLHNLIKEATRTGVVVCAAAGNTGDATHFPARWPEVVSVGEAWFYQGRWQLAMTSCRGPDLDAVAPTWGVNGLYGTSFASPVVAGAALLYAAACAQEKHDPSTHDFKALLARTGSLIDGYPEPVYGSLVHAAVER